MTGIGNGSGSREKYRPRNPKRRKPYGPPSFIDNVKETGERPEIPKDLAWVYLKTE